MQTKVDVFFLGMFVGMIALVIVMGVIDKIGHEPTVESVRQEAVQHNAAHYEATDKGEAVFTWGPKK